ncbi:MAG: ribosomal L7Ae/L30e/S12e/Gadd45 family protein [Butyrivibrio sp.]|nr:ribosomal L7Ae/L30e/S12e/Gadd45 family protein [Butyrivibrio sp.]
MNNTEKIYSLLGLCNKAGKLVSGEFATEKAVKSREAKLVIISEDASDNTKKKFMDKCKFYKVQVLSFGDKENLGHAIGKDIRTSLAITDEGLAKTLLNNLLLDKQYGGNVNGEN